MWVPISVCAGINANCKIVKKAAASFYINTLREYNKSIWPVMRYFLHIPSSTVSNKRSQEAHFISGICENRTISARKLKLRSILAQISMR